jgi:glutamyl-tRNA reductase
MMIVAVYDSSIKPSIARKEILHSWNVLSRGGIENCIDELVITFNEQAINYLCECAIGLHSVVLGDSQVYSQIRSDIIKAMQLQRTTVLNIVARYLPRLLATTRRCTALQFGKISLERIACDLINAHMLGNGTIGVIGLGRSGQLIVKILRHEMHYPLIITNRTYDITGQMARKYDAAPVEFGDLGFICQLGCLVIAIDVHMIDSLESDQYVSRLAECILSLNHSLSLIVDMCTPSLIKSHKLQQIEIISIEQLSRLAQENLKLREGELENARAITREFTKKIVSEINQV